jgi:hypothetical protein
VELGLFPAVISGVKTAVTNPKGKVTTKNENVTVTEKGKTP